MAYRDLYQQQHSSNPERPDSEQQTAPILFENVGPVKGEVAVYGGDWEWVRCLDVSGDDVAWVSFELPSGGPQDGEDGDPQQSKRCDCDPTPRSG